MTITTIKDDFIQSLEEGTPSWIVTLNDGTTVYQDDGRPDVEDSAWERLRNHCENNNVYITAMKIKFRDHVKVIPSNKDGYYFCRMARGSFGNTKTFQYFIVGTLENGILTVTRWKVPEMLDDGTEVRDKSTAGICLIEK